MLNPDELRALDARRREFERLARKDAQLAEARNLQPNKPLPHALALAKVGDMLVTMGSKLQERYGTFIEEATQTPAEAC